eukprot:c24792_g5_i1 orf=152-322(+)
MESVHVASIVPLKGPSHLINLFHTCPHAYIVLIVRICTLMPMFALGGVCINLSDMP